jgi:Tfp pilus assembly PilM family ATPase
MPRIVGIDLGSSTVKVVRLETRSRGGFEVAGFFEAEVPPPGEGQDASATLWERTSVALGT